MRLPDARFITFTLVGAFVVLLGLAGFHATAGAQAFRSGNDVTIAGNETIDSTLYASGSTLDIASRVNGDVICAGQNITISGTVEGDVICAGQNIRITGTVNGNVRLAAQTAAIEGDVEGNASLLAQSASIPGSGSIGGDLGGMTQDVTINGEVGRDIAINAANLTVNAPVGRNITASTSELVLGKAARVAGNVRYTAPRDLQRDAAATVGGEVKREDRRSNTGGTANLLPFIAYALAALLVISLALVLVFPLAFQRASNTALLEPGKIALVGLGLHIGVPILIIALGLTVIGLPLALVVGLAWILLLTLSGPATAYLLGRLVLRRNGNAVLIMLVGSVLLLVLYLIPVVNFFALIAVALFGTGSLAAALPQWRHPGYAVRPTTEVLTEKRVKTRRHKKDA